MIYEALRIAVNPDRGTLETIKAAREALKLFWWIEYCGPDNPTSKDQLELEKDSVKNINGVVYYEAFQEEMKEWIMQGKYPATILFIDSSTHLDMAFPEYVKSWTRKIP